MSYRSREIEIKLVASGVSLTDVHRLLFSTLEVRKGIYDTSTDTYWSLGEGVLGDFIRMRELSAGTIQVTVKAKDKGSNLDRVEREIDTSASPSTVRNLLSAAHGKSMGRVTKTYHVYWLAGEGEHTTVSCYTIAGHESDGVYIELESTRIDSTLELEAKVIASLEREGIQVERAGGSLWELYLQGGGV